LKYYFFVLRVPTRISRDSLSGSMKAMGTENNLQFAETCL